MNPKVFSGIRCSTLLSGSVNGAFWVSCCVSVAVSAVATLRHANRKVVKIANAASGKGKHFRIMVISPLGF